MREEIEVATGGDEKLEGGLHRRPVLEVPMHAARIRCADGDQAALLRERQRQVFLHPVGHGFLVGFEIEFYLDPYGVPDPDIFMDHAGFDTYETMYRARDVFKVTDCLVVTQGFHLPRAVYIARQICRSFPQAIIWAAWR